MAQPFASKKPGSGKPDKTAKTGAVLYTKKARRYKENSGQLLLI